MLRLGIVGAGSIGTLHIQNIVVRNRCPNITVSAVADRRESRRAWAKETLPEAAVFEEGSQLIRSGLVDAVLIAVPHYQHTDLAIDAMEHGLHVMCEKPAGVYTLQVREMNAVADAHPELVFGLMFNQRTNCTYRKVKEMLENGELGQLKRMSWIVTDWYRSQCYYDSGALVADGREGLNSLMLSNAIYLSGWTGEPVTLPIDEEKFLALLNERRAVSRVKEDKKDRISDTNYDTL